MCWDADLPRVDPEVDHPGEDGRQAPMGGHRVPEVPEVDPPAEVRRRLLQDIAQLVDVDAPVRERTADGDEARHAHLGREPTEEVCGDHGAEAVSDEHDVPVRRDPGEDQVQHLRADLGVGRVVVRLRESAVPRDDVESRLSEWHSRARVLASQAELDGPHALLELTAIRACRLADRLLGGEAGHALLLVPPAQCVRVLGGDDFRTVEVRISEFPESALEVRPPGVLHVAISDAVQEEQDRCVRHGSDSIRLRPRRPSARGCLSNLSS